MFLSVIDQSHLDPVVALELNAVAVFVALAIMDARGVNEPLLRCMLWGRKLLCGRTELQSLQRYWRQPVDM